MHTPHTLKTLRPGELTALSQDVKRVLTELYGARLDRVILFGSYARGNFHEESDVDYMVVLRDTNLTRAEAFDKHWELVWNSWEQYGVWISLKVVHTEKFTSSGLFFYRSVRQEGVQI